MTSSNRVARAGMLALACLACPTLASPPVTVTDANTESNPVTFSAGPYVVRTSEVGCATPELCDETELTVAVSPETAATQRVVVRIEWPAPIQADFDLFITQDGNSIAASASTTDPEIARFDAINGVYTILVDPYQPFGNTYTAQIYLEPLPPPGVTAPGPVAGFQIFAPPGNVGAEGGEPSIGSNWLTGSVVVGNADATIFISFDDTKSTATWVNRPAPTNVISFDPILFTDRQTGFTVVSQLVSDVVLFSNGCSLSSVTMDDGMTWIPAEGCGPPAGADHQSIGGGPYHAPLRPLPPINANAVYYCAQSVGVVLGDATCSRSDNGGLTYGPGVIVYTSECGGLHGHPRVAPDGTVYLPNKACAGADGGLGQGMAVSIDNGLTWTISVVPGSTPNPSDPSVATGLTDVGKPTGQESNTVYLGYCDGDGHPKVAVSHDQGASWGDIADVGQAAGIRNCVFPTIIAGDDDRATMAFLGTSTPGAFQGEDFTGEWHAYVATTYDGGKTWGLFDATPTDPVQIGCIWMQGGGNPCRNLLDFNDITIDKEGRPLFVFADGCVAEEKCESGVRPDFSRSAVNTVGRLSGCRTLFAEFDKTVGATDCAASAQPMAAPPAHKETQFALGALSLLLTLPLAAFAALRRRSAK